jgi:hypothetical protein
MTLVMSRMKAEVAYAVVYVIAFNSIGEDLQSFVFIISARDECAW